MAHGLFFQCKQPSQFYRNSFQRRRICRKAITWTVAHAEGYADGQISRKRGKAPNYALVGRDEYCLGFRAGYFASDRKLQRVRRDVK
jgi:hypothetical protein